LRVRAIACALGVALMLSAPPLEARPRGLRATLSSSPPELDGIPGEWDAEFRDLEFTPQGPASNARDLGGRAAIAYDANYLYVAADVTDDRLVAGGDFVEVILGVPGGTLERVRLFPGDTAQVRGVAKRANGGIVEGARVVEAPTADGWSLEARIPWSAIPKSDRIRVGYRGAIAFHDADGSRSVESVVATSDTLAYAGLPPVSMEAELSLGAGLLRERGLRMPPRFNGLADVAGDERMERVLVYDRYLVVLGPGYRAGTQYFYKDLGTGDLLRLALEDATGDRKDDIVVHQRVPEGERVEVWSYAEGADVPSLASTKMARSGSAAPTAQTEARPSFGVAREPAITSAVPVFRGVPDVKDTKSGTVFLGAMPPARSDADAVYALYRERRAVEGAPRFDVTADFAEDARAERLVVHGADLVLFGPGFRGGKSFAAITLDGDGSSFESVLARDLDGDGKAEVLVMARTAGRSVQSAYAIRGGRFVAVEVPH
jgi:hypothetical protein